MKQPKKFKSAETLQSAADIILTSLCKEHLTFNETCNVCYIRSTVLHALVTANVEKLSPHDLIQTKNAILNELRSIKCKLCEIQIEPLLSEFDERHPEFCSEQCLDLYAMEHD